MPLGVSNHVHGLPTKYSPLYFLSKYLLVDSIDIAKMFGWFSMTINLATHSSVAARHCEALLQFCHLSEIFTTLCISDWNFKSLWPQTSHPFLFLVNMWLTFWATSPPKSNPWRPRHGGGNVFRRLTGANDPPKPCNTYTNVFHWYLLQVSGFTWRCFWNVVFCFEYMWKLKHFCNCCTLPEVSLLWRSGGACVVKWSWELSGSSDATGMTSHARQAKGDDLDKNRYPGPPGWGLGVRLMV